MVSHFYYSEPALKNLLVKFNNDYTFEFIKFEFYFLIL